MRSFGSVGRRCVALKTVGRQLRICYAEFTELTNCILLRTQKSKSCVNIELLIRYGVPVVSMTEKDIVEEITNVDRFL